VVHVLEELLRHQVALVVHVARSVVLARIVVRSAGRAAQEVAVIMDLECQAAHASLIAVHPIRLVHLVAQVLSVVAHVVALAEVRMVEALVEVHVAVGADKRFVYGLLC